MEFAVARDNYNLMFEKEVCGLMKSSHRKAT